MKNTKENQWAWLSGLPEGSKIVAKNEVWIRPKWHKNEYGIRHADTLFVNVDTGELRHFSYLADLEKPPRLSCRPSIFS